ncbi:MAG: LamG domain-containing protein [Thiomargarita sp.]|nr:LamG domain-containing protein [Thiomargarita sp.]
MKFTLMTTGLLYFVGIVLANLNNGLVAYYPFNGNANDESGYDNNGTVHGATLTLDRFKKANHAYSFDGVENYIVINNKHQHNIGIGEVTLSAWIIIGDSQSDSWDGNEIGAIAGKGYLGNENGHGLYVNENKVVYQVHKGTEIVEASSDKTLNDQQWHHIVGVLERDERDGVKLYIDGQLQSTTGDPTLFQGKNLDSSIAFTIGARKHEEYRFHFNGTIDDVRIYNRALSKSEIQELYEMDEETNQLTPKKEAELSENCWAVYENNRLHIPCVKVKDESGEEVEYEVDMQYQISSDPMDFQLINAKKK